MNMMIGRHKRRSRVALSCIGLLAASAAGVARVPSASGYGTELVVNGSFEQPDVPTGTFVLSHTVPGWTLSDDGQGPALEIQDHVAGNPAPGAGAQFAELDFGPVGLHQDIETVAGRTYRLSFLYSARPNTDPEENHFRVTAGAMYKELGPLPGSQTTNWASESLTFTAAGPSTRIEFVDLGRSVAGPGYGTYLDLVSAQEVDPLYRLCSLYDQTKSHRSGSTVPIRLSLCDAAGNNLSSPAIAVHAAALTLVDTSASSSVEDAGDANPEDDFRYSAELNGTGGYIFNLSTQGLSTGTWTLSLRVDGAHHSTYVVHFDIT